MDKKQVAEWVQRDLDNAIAFLGMLKNTPELKEYIVDLAAEKVAAYEEKKKSEPELDLENGSR